MDKCINNYANQNVEFDIKDIQNLKIVEFSLCKNHFKREIVMERLNYIYKKFLCGVGLDYSELKFLYEIDIEVYKRDPRIGRIISVRDIRYDLAFLFNCFYDEIGVSPENLENRSIKYYYGDLCLNYLKEVYDLKLPEIVFGNVYLNGLKKLKNIKFPREIRGNLWMIWVKDAEGVELPKKVWGSVHFSELRKADNVVLPECINGKLYLSSKRNMDGLIIPEDYSYGGIYAPYINFMKKGNKEKILKK